MRKLLAIGEALIDFIPEQTNVGIKNVTGFSFFCKFLLRSQCTEKGSYRLLSNGR